MSIFVDLLLLHYKVRNVIKPTGDITNLVCVPSISLHLLQLYVPFFCSGSTSFLLTQIVEQSLSCIAFTSWSLSILSAGFSWFSVSACVCLLCLCLLVVLFTDWTEQLCQICNKFWHKTEICNNTADFGRMLSIRHYYGVESYIFITLFGYINLLFTYLIQHICLLTLVFF